MPTVRRASVALLHVLVSCAYKKASIAVRSISSRGVADVLRGRTANARGTQPLFES
jgi:hypothetical protein